jgi:hypothetical protein
LSEITNGDVVCGICVVNPIEHIEELNAKLTAEPFSDRNEFDERNIDILLSRAR